MFYFFFFNDTATTEIYTLSLHDALPILHQAAEHRPGEHGQQHALPPDEGSHHRHHLDVAAAHRLFLEHPSAHHADRVQQGEARSRPEHLVDEARHGGRMEIGRAHV